MDWVPPPLKDCPPIVVKLTVPSWESSDTGKILNGQTRSTVRQSAIGWHVHRCPCGHEFSHPDSAKGDTASHTCPECRKVLPSPWMASEHGVRIVESKPTLQYSVPTVRYQTCPTGNCPNVSYGYSPSRR